MNEGTSSASTKDPSLYNEDLAPIAKEKRKWGSFEIFNVWANDVQSLFGYTLAASLFITYGLNGWAVFGAIILAGLIVMALVNMIGSPSVKYGIPFPVVARSSMGVKGANVPAILRAIVAIFWYGAQTYFASTAVALMINAFIGSSAGTGGLFLGMNLVSWISFILVWVFQVILFWNGIDWITKFLNWAGPFVYAVMIVLAALIWFKSGSGLLSEMGTIFSGSGQNEGSSIGAFFAIVGTMVAYFAAVVINYGDFARFVPTEKAMIRGNFWGLPINVAFFAAIALIVTAGTVSIFGEAITDPTQIIEKIGSLPLTIIAAIMFFAATVGINLVANFIPPAYDLANLMPSRINFRMGGLITSLFALVIGGLWVALVSKLGIFGFVNTLGAVLAPVYGIIVCDYYVIRNKTYDVDALFSMNPDADYYYDGGWNKKALIVFAVSAIFSVMAVWMPALAVLSGFSWIIGAALGAVLYYMIAK